MKKHAFLLLPVLLPAIWQSASAATFQPILRMEPTYQIEAEEEGVSVEDIILQEPVYQLDKLEFTIQEDTNTLPPVKIDPLPIKTVEEEFEKVEIIPIIIKEVEQETEIIKPIIEVTEKNELSEINNIIKADTGAEAKEEDEVINTDELVKMTEPIEVLKEASQLSNLTAELTEEGGFLNYRLKVSPNFPIYKSDAAGNEEILHISPKEKINFRVKEKKFLVEDKETYDYSDLMKEKEHFSMGFELKVAEGNEDKHLTAIPKEDCIEIILNDSTQKKIEICEDFNLKENSLYLSAENEEEAILLPPLDIFYDKISSDFKEQKADVTGLKIISGEDGKPRYEISVEEHHKFLWLFPVSIRATISMEVESHRFEKVSYGWSGIFFRKKNYAVDIKVLPNLVISKVELSPRTLHMGDKLNIVVTVKNTGLKNSYAGFTSEEGPSRLALYFGTANDIEIQSKDSGFFLNPGESESYGLNWSAIMCDAPISIVINPDNRIEESSTSDNRWDGIVKCLPSNAPDLTVTNVKNLGGAKKIGALNEVQYTIKNEGSMPAPESTAFFEWEGLSSSVLVPALEPGASINRIHKYTPQKCTPVRLVLDYADKILEHNEDNNIGLEPVGDCFELPDLLVDHVWWTADDVTSGPIYAGKPLWFRVRVKNEPSAPTLNKACVNSFTATVKKNGVPFKTLNYGKTGCVPNHSNNHPDFWVKNAEFTYIPQCNGEKLTVVIDPNNAVSESRENNNSWSFDIVCSLPPPIATPN